MERNIQGYSIDQAFQYLLIELKAEELELPKNKKVIDFDTLDIDHNFEEEYLSMMSGTGYCVGVTVRNPSDNPNQNQTQVIDTKYPSGDKKWKTVYLAVYDNPFGDEIVPDSLSETKKACVDIARTASAEENRDCFIIMGKETVGFPRCSAQVLYKPSPKQNIGEYQFIW